MQFTLGMPFLAVLGKFYRNLKGLSLGKNNTITKMVNILYYIRLKSVSKSNISYEVYLNLFILYYVHYYHVFISNSIFSCYFVVILFKLYYLKNYKFRPVTSCRRQISIIACRPYDLFL